MPAVQTSRITLNLEPTIKEKARNVAQSRGISVSALVNDLVSDLPDDTPPLDLSNTPILARVLSLSSKKVKLPKDWDYRKELHERLDKKYAEYLK